MLNRKQVCESSRTCENGKTFNGTATFFLMPNYNNKFNPSFYNSKTEIVNNTIKNLNTNRIDAELCSYDTKQQKLSLRRKPTPYRVPFNHYRKTYNKTLDTTNCTPNEKIIKNIDISSCSLVDGILTPVCVKPNYTTTRLVNKFGMRNKNSGGDYRNYLERTGKLYEQNAFGILPENQDLNGVNLYKINTVNGTTKSPDCKLKYKTATSLTSNTNQLAKINTATRKWANPGYNSRTSVTSRNRIQQLKYNTILGGQLSSRGGVNNCVNGQDCSLYVSPQYGSNNGVKSNKYVPISRSRSKCNGRRLAGMRQTCAPAPPPPPPPPPNYLNWSVTSSIVINIPSPINFSSIQVTGVSPGFLKLVKHSFISTGFIELHENFGAAFSNIPSAMIINTNVPMMVVVYDPAWEPFVNCNSLMTMFVMSDYNGSNIKSPDYDYNDITVTIAQGSRTTSVPHFSQSGTHWFGPHPFGHFTPLANESLNFQQWDGDSYNGGSAGSQQFDDITTPLFSPGITITISTV